MSKESYARGFCKAASAAGVDPVQLAKFAQNLDSVSGPGSNGRFSFRFSGTEDDLMRPVSRGESKLYMPDLKRFGAKQVLLDLGDNNFLCEMDDGSIRKLNYQDGPYGEDLTKIFGDQVKFTGEDFRRGKKTLSFRKVMDLATAHANGLRKKDSDDIKRLFNRDTLSEWIDKKDYDSFDAYKRLLLSVSPEIDIAKKNRRAQIRNAILRELRQPPKNQGYGPSILAERQGGDDKLLDTHSSVEFYRDHSGKPHLAFHS